MKIFLRRYIYKTAILVVITILLTACSSTRFIYSFIDDFIQDEITYFLDLNEKEELLLSQQVSEMVNWHRTSMLPRYATYLINVADKIEKKEYESADINKLLENARFLIEQTISGLIPYASKFLINYLTNEDIEFMEKRMLIRQQERITELSKSEDILYKERLKRLNLNFERFFGDLNDSQKTLLESHTSQTLGESRVRLHNRTLRQKVFIRFLKTQPTETVLIAFTEKLLIRGHLITNPSYEDFSATSLKRFEILLVNMLSVSSEVQLKTIIDNLRAYASDFEAVSM
tara:strand:- start:115 stop:978 length:864 start_codon:yes stop_codon:yes gene_type:complete